MVNIREKFQELFGDDRPLSSSEFVENSYNGGESVEDSAERRGEENEHPSSSSEFVENSYDESQFVENSYNEAEIMEESNNEVQSSEHNSVENEVVIAEGEIFDSVDDLFNAYQDHARRIGFSVKKQTTKKKHFQFACHKAGIPKEQQTRSKKVGCKARLNAKLLDDGRCQVTSMFTEHNHNTDPEFSILMPAHRQLTVNLKRQLEANDRTGIRVCKNVRLCEVQCGGPENLGCTPKDCRNYIDKRRRLRLGDGDAEAIRSMFVLLQLKNPNFFYVMDIDGDCRLCNVLWIHPRSRAAYKEFHDVVSFDTTYLVNRYKMPFGSFVGVNHHGHSMLLGCALMAHEDADTFKWIFRNWLQAMDGIQPNAIITDQCDSIRIAINDVFPNTVHRWCIWHILSKLPVKLKGVRDYKACCKELKGIVYESLDIASFESGWSSLLEKYRLQNNKWLRQLYRDKKTWVPVFLDHIFWAGMMSTQRSESMHSYFDEFFHSRSTLKQFMEQYDMAMSSKIQKEFAADFDSKNKVIKCQTEFGWEKQFQREYTNSIFELVQQQIKKMHYCHVVGVDQVEDSTGNLVGIQKFRVRERFTQNNFYHRELTYTVDWRPNGSYISCNCRKFEFKGILCCHIMEVLSRENIQTVHGRYIIDRWKKTLYRPHSKIFFAGGYPHMTEEYKKYQEVEKIFQECMDIAMGSVDRLKYVKECCSMMKEGLVKWEEAGVVPDTPNATNIANSDAGSQTLLDPNVAATRGRPTKKQRLMTAVEASTRAQTGKRKGRPPLPRDRDPTTSDRRTNRGRGGSDVGTSGGLHGHDGLQLIDESEVSLPF